MQTHCELISLDQFHDFTATACSSSLICLHANMKCKKENADSLKSFFCSPKNGLDVVCLSGTRDSKHIPRFDGYQTFHGTVKRSKNGGVAMLVKSSIESTKRIDLKDKISNSEHLWVELTPRPSKGIVVGVIYRHSQSNSKSKLQKFSRQFFTILSKLKSEEKRIFIFGNFNINFLPTKPILGYMEELKKINFRSLIDRPTEIDFKKSQACLTNHIYTNEVSCNFSKKSGVIETIEFSNQFPTYCAIPKNVSCDDLCKTKSDYQVDFHFKAFLGFEKDDPNLLELSDENFNSSVKFTNGSYEKFFSLIPNQFQTLKLLLTEITRSIIKFFKNIICLNSSPTSPDVENLLKVSNVDLVVTKLEKLQKLFVADKFVRITPKISLPLEILDEVKSFLEITSVFLKNVESNFPEFSGEIQKNLKKLYKMSFIFALETTTKLLQDLANEVENIV